MDILVTLLYSSQMTVFGTTTAYLRAKPSFFFANRGFWLICRKNTVTVLKSSNPEENRAIMPDLCGRCGKKGQSRRVTGLICGSYGKKARSRRVAGPVCGSCGKKGGSRRVEGQKTVIMEISPIWEISTITVFYLKL